MNRSRSTFIPASLGALVLITSACSIEISGLTTGAGPAGEMMDDMETSTSTGESPVGDTEPTDEPDETDESEATGDDPEPPGSTGEPGSHCGNDVVEEPEQCDGAALGGVDCLALGYDGGSLACADNCSFDESACTTFSCGNDLLEGAEPCDGLDVGGYDCVDLGYDAGALGCEPGCTGFDISGCVVWSCGNDVIDGMEVCDGMDLSEERCTNLGYDAGVLGCMDSCLAFDTSGCVIWSCGNGLVEGAEVCDGVDMGVHDCQSEGFDYGTLGCRDNCDGLDTSGCDYYEGDCCAAHDGVGCGDPTCVDDVCAVDPNCCDGGWDESCADTAAALCPDVCSSCGNNLIDDPAEACDQYDLAGKDCVGMGFTGGVLACTDDCSFDTSGCVQQMGGDCCVPRPGLGCEVPQIEACVCALDDLCCESEWSAECAALAFDNCNAICEGCGNDLVDHPDEVCDGADLAGQVCGTVGLDHGTLACLHDCSGFDVSGCLGCGNDVVEEGEACDGFDLGGEDCISQGYGEGALACASDCSGFDVSGCGAGAP